ncbi:MAG: GNAT family N-acetyltransferase [Verrucomicrobia bacterium]|nr:GNAT family N-acetyltransferase [Verrucomicrobiota bacterium]
MTQNGLRCALINAVRSAERGIIKGKDQLYAGKVDRVDVEFIRQLLEKEIVPVLGPVAHSRDGNPLRVNSDLLAAEVARELQASKLIFMFPEPGLTIQGEFRLNISVQEVREVLEKHPDWIPPNVRSKAEHAVRTIESGTPRAHLIDCRIHDGLLTEIFSKVGIGSMIHSNPYAQIRRAKRKDVATIYNITKSAVKTEALRQRTRLSIERSVQDYLVYEIDDSVIGCVRLSSFGRSTTVELGSVYVQSAYQGRNIGKALVDYACDLARGEGKKRVVALTTQAYGFFRKVCGFQDGELKDLPPVLRNTAKASGRNSKILVKSL